MRDKSRSVRASQGKVTAAAIDQELAKEGENDFGKGPIKFEWLARVEKTPLQWLLAEAMSYGRHQGSGIGRLEIAFGKCFTGMGNKPKLVVLYQRIIDWNYGSKN